MFKEKGESKPKPKRRLYIARNSVFATLAALFMGLSIICRLIEYWGFWHMNMPDFRLYSAVLLPMLAAALYLLLLVIGGRAALWLTLIPTWMICAFFILHALSFEWWQMISYIMIYLLLGVIYTVTVTSRPRALWLLLPISLLPPAYQLGVEARMLWLSGRATMGDWIAQLSLLLPMLGILCVVLGMRRVKPKQEGEPLPVPQPAPAQPEPAVVVSDEEAAVLSSAAFAAQRHNEPPVVVIDAPVILTEAPPVRSAEPVMLPAEPMPLPEAATPEAPEPPALPEPAPEPEKQEKRSAFDRLFDRLG